jgi:hypothetical protein
MAIYDQDTIDGAGIDSELHGNLLGLTPTALIAAHKAYRLQRGCASIS